MGSQLERLYEGATAGHRLSAWLERIRLRYWVHFLLLPLATFDPSARSADAFVAAARGIGNAFAILAFGYLLNSVSDRLMDLDPRKNPLIDAGAGEHRASLVLLFFTSVILAFFSPWPAQLATIACLGFGCAYSVGPRLKSIPIVGSLTNLANFVPLLFVGMRDTSLPPGFGCLVLAFATLLLQNQLIHEAADNDEDRRGGVRTTWQLLGPSRTALVAGLLGLGATMAAACLVSPRGVAAVVALCGGVFGLTFPRLLARQGRESDHAARLRVAHRWCALIAGVGLFTAWQ